MEREREREGERERERERERETDRQRERERDRETERDRERQRETEREREKAGAAQCLSPPVIILAAAFSTSTDCLHYTFHLLPALLYTYPMAMLLSFFLFCSLHDNTNGLLPNLEQNPQPPPLVKVNKPDGINPALTGKMKCILFQVTDWEKKRRRRDDWRY